MQKKPIKIASLNLWRFNDWDSRLPRILDLVQKVDPDLLLLQEVQKDPSLSTDDQATILRQKLGYPYSHFEIACIKTARKGIPLPNPVEHGLGIISKLPFQAKAIRLAQAQEDPEPRIVLKADFSGGIAAFSVLNVHFANKDAWAEAHLNETLGICKAEENKPILAGDFNIKKISDHKKDYRADYTASSDMFSYISYPGDGVSYDQILIPHNWEFVGFECFDESISDHRLICGEIQKK